MPGISMPGIFMPGISMPGIGFIAATPILHLGWKRLYTMDIYIN